MLNWLDLFRNKFRICYKVLVILIPLFLTACGGGGDSGDDSDKRSEVPGGTDNPPPDDDDNAPPEDDTDPPPGDDDDPPPPSGSNQAPSANAGPDQRLDESTEVSLSGSASSDPDGDPLSYSWTVTAQPSASRAILSNENAEQSNLTPDVEGLYSVQLVVNDGVADSNPDTVQVIYSTTPPAPEDQVDFSEVTTSVFDELNGYSPTSAPFEGDFAHLNNDGCLDVLVQSHGTDAPDGHWLQNVSGGVCEGTFSYNPTDYRSRIGNTRFTSSALIADFDNDGDQDIQGWDADGGSSLKAVTSNGDLFEPDYSPTEGCVYSRDRCLFIDYNGDGVLELINGTSLDREDAGDFGSIYRQNSTEILWTPEDNVNTRFSGSVHSTWAPALVGDYNGDSWPDMAFYQHGFVFLNDQNGGFTKLDQAFPHDPPASGDDPTLSNLSPDQNGGIHSNAHMRTNIDYDNDGDMDIFVIRVPKAGNNPLNPGHGIFLLENNGNASFTDVTSAVMPNISLTSVTYQTTYAGARANDYDNNGYTDLMVDWVEGSFVNTCVFLMNYGNSWEKRSFSCYYIGSSNDGRVPATGGASKTVFDDGDYDQDGLLDFVSSNAQRTPNHDTVSLWRNTTSTTNRYLKVFIRGAATREGWHTRVFFKEPDTDIIIATRDLYAWEQGGDTEIHAGLGQNETVDIEVVFPHGSGTRLFENVNTNQTLVISPSDPLIENWVGGNGLP